MKAEREPQAERREPVDLRLIVVAAAAGTTFEWYDFFIFGTLATVIGKVFFAGLSDTMSTLFALLTFALGFMARPIGALIFGHIGDRKGRKGTFLYTIVLMGLATILIGFLPTFRQAGVVAPVLLLVLRVLQGIALGGEYGGASTYVAEHAPAARRGFFTVWTQSAAPFGLITALGVILVTRQNLGESAFADWGWRIPFIVSSGLLLVSVYIRARTSESPSFQALHRTGGLSASPFKDSFLHWPSLKQVLIALFGFMTVQGATFYASYFYSAIFLEKIVRLDGASINGLILGMTVVQAILFVPAAWLSDRIGRKPVMLAGIAIATLAIFPGFQKMLEWGNPALDAAMKTTPVVISADPATCHVEFDVTGKAVYTSSCDRATALVTNLGVAYVRVAGTGETLIHLGGAAFAVSDATHMPAPVIKADTARLSGSLKAALVKAGYPAKADPARANLWGIFAVLSLFSLGSAGLYGPMAAQLVEMFPTRIRYTALSLPYNIGTGWFGGLMPAIAFAMVAASGNVMFGLWYPVVIGISGFVVTALFMKDRHGQPLD